MQTPFDFPQSGRPIVYVKAVDVTTLPDEVRAGAGGLDHLYAVHNEAGEQLALVADRRLAFVLARQHNLTPVPVH